MNCFVASIQVMDTVIQSVANGIALNTFRRAAERRTPNSILGGSTVLFLDFIIQIWTLQPKLGFKHSIPHYEPVFLQNAEQGEGPPRGLQDLFNATLANVAPKPKRKNSTRDVESTCSLTLGTLLRLSFW